MMEPRASLYHRHRFPAEIIAEAVWLYYRFPLSFRMVEDMLAYRGYLSPIRQYVNGQKSLEEHRPIPFAVAHLALVTNGTWMRLLSRSKESAIFCGVPLIKMALCLKFWFKNTAIKRLQNT